MTPLKLGHYLLIQSLETIQCLPLTLMALTLCVNFQNHYSFEVKALILIG
ncbi:hypothetical protein [Porphyromonas gingivicanis]|nr:hypothetical protein [Porphyromonas gingivicanis]